MTAGASPHTVTTSDGWNLEVASLAADEPVAVAVLGHAMMVDRRSMDRPPGDGLASTLARRGIAVHLADLRGHGGSGPTPAEGGSWSYDDIVRFDLPSLLADARARHPGLPAWLVGHSLAGHCSLAAAGSGAYGDAPPDGHVLFAANLWVRGLDPHLGRSIRRTLSGGAMVGLAALFGRFPSRLLRMGPADEAAPYSRDLVRFWMSGRWGSADGAHDYLDGLSAVRGPVLALAGAGDALFGHPVNLRAWTERLTAADLDLRVLAAGDLGLTRDPGHMDLVTDPGSRGVWEEVASWIRARSAC